MTAHRSILLFLLLIAVVAFAGNHNRHHRHRRNHELHDWLSQDQKNVLNGIDKSTPEFKKKVEEFYSQLPVEKQIEWNSYYKKHCFKWTEKVQSKEEQESFNELLKNKDVEGARKKVAALKLKLGEEEKKSVELWENSCYDLIKKASRKRRELDSSLQEFIKWMTPEQKSEIGKLKADGKSDEVIGNKAKEFFGALPAAKQTELKEEYKGKCKIYFQPLLTAEEGEKIKTLSGDKDAIAVLIRGAVNRQEGSAKAIAEKMFNICGEVYKGSSRKRREIDAAFEEFTKWMNAEQKTELGELKKAGKSDDEIRQKSKEFFDKLPADKQTEVKEDLKGKCKAYFAPLLKSEEADNLKNLVASGDKDGAAAVVRGVVNRQEGTKKTVAEKMFNVCGEVYKQSSRMRREIEAAFKDFITWMTPEQKAELAKLKTDGKSDDVIRDKSKEFFGQLPAQKQTELREDFKGKCKVYFKPLLTADEEAKIKTLTGDKDAIVTLVRGAVNRQEGSAKTIAEKMFNLCGEVYKEPSRKRRELDAAFKEFVSWMTPEQKNEIGALKSSGKSDDSVRDKAKEFFEQLPAAKQAELRADFKIKCKVYFKPLLTVEEEEKIKTLTGDKDAIVSLVRGAVNRQEGGAKAVAEKMFNLCGEVYKDSTRKRRELDPAFTEFLTWLTPEQKTQLGELKAAGKSDNVVHEKVKEFFGQLPEAKQTELKDNFKGKCKVYFQPLLKPEEAEKLKGLVASGDKDAAGTVIKGVVNRQEGKNKEIAEKMYNVCGEVYKDVKKSKRDVRTKVEKHLAWLNPEEKDEIVKMTNDGKSKEDIRKKLFSFVENHEKDSTQKEKSIKKCYEWMNEVATKEEQDSLHKLHHVDHGACKKKVREFISRLSQEKQTAVEASLPFCEKLWYGDHAEHAEHDHSAHGHHHRRKRHFTVIEKYLDWLDNSQKETIKEMETSGAEFTKISDKIQQFFKMLPEDKQTELKSSFKNQCMIWAKEVAKPGEWESIKKHYAESDFQALKLILVELEGRLTENQKHTIEHVRGVCYKLWGIKGLSRLRRVAKQPEIDSFEYVQWMNFDQLIDVKILMKQGKTTEIVENLKKFYDELPNSEKTMAESKMRDGCKAYSVKYFGEENASEIQKLFEENVKESAIRKKTQGFIDGITDESEKEAAEMVILGCKNVHEKIRNRLQLDSIENIGEYMFWSNE